MPLSGHLAVTCAQAGGPQFGLPGRAQPGEQVALIRRPPRPSPAPPLTSAILRPLQSRPSRRPSSARAAPRPPRLGDRRIHAPAVWGPLRRRSGRLPAAPGGPASPCAPRAPSRRPHARGGGWGEPPLRSPRPAPLLRPPGGCGRCSAKGSSTKLLQLRPGRGPRAQRRPRRPRARRCLPPPGLKALVEKETDVSVFASPRRGRNAL